MFKSRTITISLRFYGALAVAAFIGAYIVGATSQHSSIIDQVVGPIDLGWKGGVGNHLGYTLLVGVAVAAAFLATMLTVYRDADPDAEAQAAGLESVPLARAPIGANYWPVISAFAVGALLVGLAISSKALALTAAIVLGGTVFMWTMRAWAERATGDDRVNLRLYQQVVEPLRLPLTALLLVGAVIAGFSRILLTLPDKHASTAVFGVIGAVVFFACVLIALRPKISRTPVVLAVFILGLLVLVGGIVGAARGPRTFEHRDPGTGVQVQRGSGR
jgi:hypothetical protein